MNLSLSGRRFSIRNPSLDAPLVERVLAARGIVDAANFLTPEFHTPEKLKDLPRAIERIRKAVADGEKILIVGDYDVDGVTASSILFLALRELGAQVSVRLPHREKHGYGLNEVFVREAAQLGVGLIVTVDNGISAAAEVALANDLEIDVIVTDHHLPPAVLPAAFAIVDPRREDCEYPCSEICGATVALKIAENLLPANHPRLAEFRTLAGIGTIADVCPLVGENRALAAAALTEISRTQNFGLRRLLELANLNGKISAEDIAFRISPRINAAGRLDDPLLAFQTFTHARGAEFADRLEILNRERQEITRDAVDDALEQLGEIGTEKILIVRGEWHPGVIGLVAGRLAERFHRPAIALAETATGLVGSCRCPLPEFNITAALAENSDLLTKFGGHRAAAGFTLAAENFAEFTKKMTEVADREISEKDFVDTLALDSPLAESEITLDNFHALEKLQPFGEGNPLPLFLLSAAIADARIVGNGKSHLQLKIGDRKTAAIFFGGGEFFDPLALADTAELAVSLDENVWNGSRKIQLIVEDARV